MAAFTKHEALIGPQGFVDVTRIEFEVLPGQTFRWTVWDGENRLVSAPFKLHDLFEYLSRTEMLLEVMDEDPPVNLRS